MNDIAKILAKGQAITREVLGELSPEELRTLRRCTDDVLSVLCTGEIVVIWDKPFNCIHSIKALRYATGLGLRDTKDIVMAGRMIAASQEEAQKIIDAMNGSPSEHRHCNARIG